MIRHLSDAELVALHKGDPEGETGRGAAAEVLRRYRLAVYGWCRRYVDDHESALDLSQDVLLSAFQNLRHFEARSGIAAWLMVIARNRCLSELRKRQPQMDEEFDFGLLKTSAPDPSQLVEHKQGEEQFLELVEQHLDPVERRALWMRCVEEVPVDTITQLLDIDADAGARTILQRARRKLRRALAARDLEGGQA